MPRCYMVKKTSNKYQSAARECWEESTPSAEAPESPTEACVAPSYYTPLTSRSSSIQEYESEYGDDLPPSPQNNSVETVVQHDGGIPIFSTRSAAETEAAHDLLSLSQSLPPLPAPGAVTIHQNEDLEYNSHSPDLYGGYRYTYSPTNGRSRSPSIRILRVPRAGTANQSDDTNKPEFDYRPYSPTPSSAGYRSPQRFKTFACTSRSANAELRFAVGYGPDPQTILEVENAECGELTPAESPLSEIVIESVEYEVIPISDQDAYFRPESPAEIRSKSPTMRPPLATTSPSAENGFKPPFTYGPFSDQIRSDSPATQSPPLRSPRSIQNQNSKSQYVYGSYSSDPGTRSPSPLVRSPTTMRSNGYKPEFEYPPYPSQTAPTYRSDSPSKEGYKSEYHYKTVGSIRPNSPPTNRSKSSRAITSREMLKSEYDYRTISPDDTRSYRSDSPLSIRSKSRPDYEYRSSSPESFKSYSPTTKSQSPPIRPPPNSRLTTSQNGYHSEYEYRSCSPTYRSLSPTTARSHSSSNTSETTLDLSMNGSKSGNEYRPCSPERDRSFRAMAHQNQDAPVENHSSYRSDSPLTVRSRLSLKRPTPRSVSTIDGCKSEYDSRYRQDSDKSRSSPTSQSECESEYDRRSTYKTDPVTIETHDEYKREYDYQTFSTDYRSSSPPTTLRSRSPGSPVNHYRERSPPENFRMEQERAYRERSPVFSGYPAVRNSASPASTYKSASPVPVSVSYYQPNIVYVVQVPAVPTPPTSECSSDAENHQVCLSDKLKETPIPINTLATQNEDILILPLSPEPEGKVNDGSIHTNSVIVSPVSTPPSPSVREQSVIASSTMNIPDKRMKRAKPKNSNKPSNKSNNSKSNGASDAPSARKAKTRFYIVEDDIEEAASNDAQGAESDAGGKSSRYVCSECGKQYATSSNLSRHKQTHRSLDSQSAKKCMTCGKAYVSMPALAMHVLTHKLNHSCGVCGKQFSRPWLLQGHLRSHTGEKPYGCAHCGKAFADRSNLRAHMQTHSADKNYRCQICKKTFALKSYLNKHLESACQSTEDGTGVIEILD